MIHVMPLTSISRITKLDIEILEELSLENPVFAAGVNFFHRLGGVNEVVETLDGMKEAVARHIKEVRQLKADGQFEKLGPWGRGGLGAERGGRKTRVLTGILFFQQPFHLGRDCKKLFVCCRAVRFRN